MIYTNPRPNRAYMEEFYSGTFKSDPGAALRRGEDFKQSDPRKFDKHVKRLRPFVEPLLAQLGEPAGKRWLEVRCRDGVVAGVLATHGVEVHGVDLFHANLAAARERFGADRFHESSIYDLLGSAPRELDAIGMLTIHVLSHAPSPSQLLKDCYERLRPGGWIFMAEKDVLEPRPGVMEFQLAGNGLIAHFQHLTLNSVREYVRAAGFEIERAEYLDRWTSLRHLVVVARKPQVPTVVGRIHADDPQVSHDRIMALYRRHLVRAPVRMVQRRIGTERIKTLKKTARNARNRALTWFKGKGA